MKKLFFIFLVLGVLFLVSGRVVNAQNISEGVKVNQEASKLEDVGNKICPVTGSKIDEKTKSIVEYEGKIYNLCCSGCIDMFKADPQKYIKKIEEEKQQVPLTTQEEHHVHH